MKAYMEKKTTGYLNITEVEKESEDKNIMIKEIVKKKWDDFISQYSYYFLTKEEIWEENLRKVKEYIE